MIEHEKAMIGVICEDFKECSLVMDRLKPEYFTDVFCRGMFKACVKLSEKDIPIDFTNMIHQGVKLGLFKNEIGETDRTMVEVIANWMNHSLSFNWESYANGIIETYAEQNTIRLARRYSELDFSALEVSEVISEIKNDFSELSSLLDISHKHIKDDAGSILEDMYMNIDTRDRVRISTGYPSLDKSVGGGFKKSELVILAARPGMGKSALAMNMAVNMAKNGIPTALVSLEMSKEDILGRVMNMEKGFNYDNLSEAKGFGVWHDQMSKLKLFINDDSEMDIKQLRAYVSGKVEEEGLKVLFVDYLQLLTGYGGNVYEQVRGISRGLKIISREFDITIIALAQLNRKVEERADKMPFASDLKDSGSIEQDADRILMMMRPGQYNPDESQSLCNIYIRKSRDGVLGTVPLHFNGARMRFTEPSIFI